MYSPIRLVTRQSDWPTDYLNLFDVFLYYLDVLVAELRRPALVSVKRAPRWCLCCLHVSCRRWRNVRKGIQQPYCSCIRYSNGSWNWNWFGGGWDAERVGDGKLAAWSFWMWMNALGFVIWIADQAIRTSISELRMTYTERIPCGTRGGVLSLQGKSLSWRARCSQISFNKYS